MASTLPPNGSQEIGGPPEGRRANKPNMVAAAVELAGGPSAVARLCGVRRQSVYLWINEWRVERLIDALRSSRVSGIPIEKLAGEAYDKLEDAAKAAEGTPTRRPSKK